MASFRFVSCILCLTWAHVECLRESTNTEALATDLQEQAHVLRLETTCSDCSKYVDFQRVFGFEWVLFPPSPFPNPIYTMICTPNPAANWDSTEVAGICDKDMMDSMTDKEKDACSQSAAPKKSEKKSSISDIPVRYMTNMMVCGKCAVCSAFARVRSLWLGLKHSINQVLKKIGLFILGATGSVHADKKTIAAMSTRISELISHAKDTPGTSVLEVGSSSWPVATTRRQLAWNASAEDKDQFIESALLEAMHNMTKEEKLNHLSKVETALQETDKLEESILNSGFSKQMVALKYRKAQLTRALPNLLSTPECQRALDGMNIKATLEIAVNIEFPDLSEALMNAALGSPAGALLALIPEVLMMAIPKENKALKAETMRDCLDMLNNQQQDFLETCSHERPVMACVARTYQRILGKALWEKWFPVDDKVKNPLEANRAIMAVSQHSCLENRIKDVEKEERSAQMLDIESDHNSPWYRYLRFEKMQCPLVSGRVDEEDGNDGEAKISDRLWVAAIMSLGKQIDVQPQQARTCPNLIPYVTAFCASEFNCVEEPDIAGESFADDASFQAMLAQSEASFNKFDVNGDGAISEDEEKQAWQLMTQSLNNVGMMDGQADVLQWNLLWHIANRTNPGRRGNSWPEIQSRIEGTTSINVNWVTTSNFWSNIYSFMLKMLMKREQQYKKAQNDNGKAIHEVLADLDQIYKSHMCGADGVGVMSMDALRLIGVSKEAAEQHFAVQTEESRKPSRWAILRVQVEASFPFLSAPQALTNFEDLTKTHACKCMCYTLGDKLKASVQDTCDAPGEVHDVYGTALGKTLEAKNAWIQTSKKDSEQELGPTSVTVVHQSGSDHCTARVAWRTASGTSGTGYISACGAPSELQDGTLDKIFSAGPKRGYLSIPIVTDDTIQ
jgi:hypothetical protein